jgi:hypothetical protein
VRNSNHTHPVSILPAADRRVSKYEQQLHSRQGPGNKWYTCSLPHRQHLNLRALLLPPCFHSLCTPLTCQLVVRDTKVADVCCCRLLLLLLILLLP